MADPILEIKTLTKAYGKTKALNNLNLTVQRGDVYGLIGPNGAGKTTCFKICATILKPTWGVVKIDGLLLESGNSANVRQIRRLIGYMPDSFGVYEDMTVEEYLSFFAAAYDIVNPKRQRLVDDVLKIVDLESKKDALVDTLSRGMQQRLGLARVLIHDPQLLILDEPASGLDPRARVEIRSLLVELQKMGKTILISSHILADIGEICNRIGILEQGELKVEGSIGSILAMVKPSPIVHVRVVADTERARELLSHQPFVDRVHVEGETIVLEVAEGFDEIWRINEELIKNGFKVSHLEQEAKSLEHAFMQLTEGRVQ